MATRGYTPVKQVVVKLWGQEIGRLAPDPKLGIYVFAYTEEFCATGIQPAPLHAPAIAGQVYAFPSLSAETYHRLPAFIADALPDKFGNSLINRYMAEKGVASASITSLDRLAYLGSRAMGALIFEPDNGPSETLSSAIEMNQLVLGAREALSGTFSSESASVDALKSIIEVGTSAGGARAKAVIAVSRETGEIRSGQLDAPPEYDHWLLKFDGMVDTELSHPQNYGRIEYAYYIMALAAGIRMTESRLLEENGRAHFMTRRFDRDAGDKRNHMQTLCAMAHLDFNLRGANSYTQLFACIRQLGLPYVDMEQAFRRMAFNVMAKNCDDHTKNTSFVLSQNDVWRLSPGYDITFAYNPNGEWTYQHLMAVNGKYKDITRADLMAEAERYGIGTAAEVLNEVAGAITRWDEAADIAKIAKKEKQDIAGMLQPLS